MTPSRSSRASGRIRIGEQMPGVEAALGRSSRQVQRQTLQAFEIEFHNRLSSGLKVIDPLQLRQSDCGREVSQIVLEAGCDNVIGPSRANAIESIERVPI